MIGVRTDLAGYRTAIAELPARVRLGGADAEIVVLPRDIGTGAVVAAQGARVAVLDRPRLSDGRTALDALERHGCAVVVVRSGIRPDDAADAVHASAEPAAVTVQAHVARGALDDAIVDGVGWARVLVGGPLAVRLSTTLGDAVIADLAGERVDAALIASERLSAGGLGRLRATTVGPERVDVVSAGGRSVVSRSTAAGDLALPRRWESPERLALRRALAALGGEDAPTDAEDWRHDAAVAATILGRG